MGNCCYDPPYGYNAAGAFGPYTTTTTTTYGVAPGVVPAGVGIMPGGIATYPGTTFI
jgi:hypothetical protein